MAPYGIDQNHDATREGKHTKTINTRIEQQDIFGTHQDKQKLIKTNTQPDHKQNQPYI